MPSKCESGLGPLIRTFGGGYGAPSPRGSANLAQLVNFTLMISELIFEVNLGSPLVHSLVHSSSPVQYADSCLGSCYSSCIMSILCTQSIRVS